MKEVPLLYFKCFLSEPFLLLFLYHFYFFSYFPTFFHFSFLSVASLVFEFQSQGAILYPKILARWYLIQF